MTRRLETLPVSSRPSGVAVAEPVKPCSWRLPESVEISGLISMGMPSRESELISRDSSSRD